MTVPILALTLATLLAPTGPYAVGRTTYVWRDAQRIDELSAPPAAREVRVHLFYPARRTRNAKPAPYVPDLAALDKISGGYLREDFGSAYETLMQLRGHALDRPPAAASPRKFPLVVFSHGGGVQVLYYSALHEELASRGYVVAAVEHPYDMDYVFLPGGRVIEQKEWQKDAERTPQERAEFHRRRHEVNARDNSFVLDQLAKLDSGAIPSPLRHRLDLSRATAIGHSLGGKASVVSCAIDPRWRSCINLDGGLDPGERYPAVRQPVLALYGGPSPIRLEAFETEEAFEKRRERNKTFLQSEGHKKQMTEYANVHHGAVVYVVSPGFSHFSHYDLLKPDAEPWGATPERAQRNLEILRRCILAFLENPTPEALRSVDAQLLIVPFE